MAQVKFIQLGTFNEPIANADYQSKLDQTKKNYPGAIIFATYWSDDKQSERVQEIHANGEKYSVGGGGGGTVYVGDAEIENGVLKEPGTVWKDGFSTGTDITNFIDYTFKYGDIYIYKTSWDASSSESSGYVYVKKGDSGRWEALAGAVSAENVWFYDDITLAGDYTAVGNIKRTDTTIDVSNKGMTLKTLIDRIFTKELKPLVGNPVYSFTANLTAPSISLDKTKTQYVGTKIVLSKIIQNDSSCSESIKLSGLTYGYAVNGTKHSDQTYSRSQTEHETSGDYTLKATISGFKTKDGNAVSLSAAKNAQGKLELPVTDLYVGYGTNGVSITETGLTYTAKGFTRETVQVLTNLGNVSEERVAEHASGDTEAPKPQTRSTYVTGVWPVYYTALTSDKTEFTGEDLLGYTAKQYETSWATTGFDVTLLKGTKEFVIAKPSTVSTSFSSMLNTATSTPFTPTSKIVTIENVNVTTDGGFATTYTVVYAWLDKALNNDNTFNIKFK